MLDPLLSGSCGRSVFLCDVSSTSGSRFLALLAAAERKLLTEQAERSGKPANVIERMVGGRLHKVRNSCYLFSIRMRECRLSYKALARKWS